ncbi:hypothetical protein B9479_005610 [Cryptococcus floricola]|uniref:NAD-dependent epimerase/dehydratase domain-containing protein n=1 Tax=Cryptococcus floricola TaxID=2591691 RepID=A0A5D3AUL9_9TREE|nr:hypothetical protein B9479_005610 [Cryptococcus floricola]
MPNIVAITGINGFIATELVLLFLTRAWHVRGSVRTPLQAQSMKDHPVYKEWVDGGKLEVVVVPDMAGKEGGEVEGLLEGVRGVVCMAAPLPGADTTSWPGFRDPTIQGIKRVLEYAQKSSTIKSVVIMSSVGGTVDWSAPPEKVFTEDDWIPFSDEDCQADGSDINPGVLLKWYGTAKRMAEQYALEFQEKEKPGFSIATVAPPMVYGPPIYIPTPSDLPKLQYYQQEFFSLFAGGKDRKLPEQMAQSWVDVRDVAEAFCVLVEREGRGRYLISGGEYKWQEWADKLHALRPDLDEHLALGEPGKYPDSRWKVDGSKSVRELGMKYRTAEETLKDTLAYFEKMGVFEEAAGAWKI